MKTKIKEVIRLEKLKLCCKVSNLNLLICETQMTTVRLMQSQLVVNKGSLSTFKLRPDHVNTHTMFISIKLIHVGWLNAH